MVVDPRYRYLVPASQFAGPDGLPGKKTQTWFGVKGEPLFARAGLCKNTEHWGPCYGGMTSDSNDTVKNFNPRMPTLLPAGEWNHWLSRGIKDVIAIQFPSFPADRLEIFPTDAPWIARNAAPTREPEPQFL
jgi:putative SOS response-associated peptidase YedK